MADNPANPGGPASSSPPPEPGPGAAPAFSGPPRRPRQPLSEILATLIREMISRGYALALIVAITYLTFASIRYLIAALVTPSRAPGEIRNIAPRLTADVLEHHRGEMTGLTAVERPRTPLSHYHRMDTWIAADRYNNCTQSGCHAPLPHAENKGTRAFLNMHATTLHCGVCHLSHEQTPLPLTWYSLATGKPAEEPAALRAYDWLIKHGSTESRRACTQTDRDALADLLHQAGLGADGDPALLRLAEQVRATRPGRDEFVRVLDVVMDAVVRSFRGAYGEKIALADPRGGPILAHPDTAGAVAAYLRTRPPVDSPERAAQLKAIHPQRREKARVCGECHTPRNGLLDLAKLGYPPQRIEALHSSAVFKMIEKIGTGESFQYPTFINPTRAP